VDREQSLFELERPDGSRVTTKSMISDHEAALCYAAGRHCWRGEAIVDLGPLAGLSTYMFARGLTEGDSTPDRPVIHAFDLWRAVGGYDSYFKDFDQGGAGSIQHLWMRTVAGYESLLYPHAGDFLGWRWDGRPIDVLFVDIAKTWALHNHVTSTMIPCLRPGSLLIHQDYVHWNEPWIHIEMARLRSYFRRCYILYGATSFYECIETPPRDLCETPANSLPYAAQVELIDDERSQAPALVAQVMLSAAAKHAAENKDFSRAFALLDEVNPNIEPDNPLQDFRLRATDNRNQTRNYISKLRESVV